MRIQQLWIIILLIFFTGSSCKKYLDVSSSNLLLEEDIFKQGNGVRTAVNGVYRLLSSQDLYGKNLTWGMVSAMGNNYNPSALPTGIKEAAAFNWQSANAMTLTQNIWNKGYNVIANCNNIIKQVSNADNNMFEYGEGEKNMILGEMYGVRAMMHFDLCRLFVPAPITGYSGAAMPYVRNYPERQPVHENVQNLFKLMIEDMSNARTLLAEADTNFVSTSATSIVPVFIYSSGRIRMTDNYVNVPMGEFFNYRAERMNYFAANALMARMYLYMGDYVNAEKMADIANEFYKDDWYSWTSPWYQGASTDLSSIYPKRPEELLLTFSNNNTLDNYEAVINTNTSYMKTPAAYVDKLFEGDFDDYRKVGYYNRYNDNRFINWARPQGSSSTMQALARDQGPLLPVIRFSECLHIKAECLLKKGAVNDAIDVLNEIRINRGAKAELPQSLNGDEVLDILVNDFIRETMVEGQTFYMFKRLNRNIFNGATNIIVKPQDWTIPLPASETDYMF